MKKSTLIYPVTIGIFALFIFLVINKGKELRPLSESSAITIVSQLNKTIPLTVTSKQTIQEQFLYNIKSPLGILLLQIITILFVSKLFGRIAKNIGQPSVVGEMVGGIFLGPSCIGYYFPHFSEFLFSKASLVNLQYFSSLGLVFFMFIIGMELDISKLRKKAQKALLISHISIIFPYFLGVLLSYFLYERFAPEGVGFLAFALFIGISMSITAFPVLARIIQERNLTKTEMGAMALTCAAADDVTAWCILAAVVAIVKAGSLMSALLTILLALLFVLFMIFIVQKQVKKLHDKYEKGVSINKTMVLIVFFVLLSSAYIAEVIGIHALFGAFLAGVIMPQNLGFKERLALKIEDVSILLLLPLFFALTGLRTQIGLLNEGNLWLIFALIVSVAVAGKFGGSAVSARIVGYSWKDSLSIGTLMNTRGLMELIVLNIGYDLGILSPPIFAMMVLMALFTTFMTGPSLDLIEYINSFKKNPK
jgi:Kef-type K+ transport system membrane component KefB